jgi:hypothetical protein
MPYFDDDTGHPYPFSDNSDFSYGEEGANSPPNLSGYQEPAEWNICSEVG